MAPLRSLGNTASIFDDFYGRTGIDAATNPFVHSYWFSTLSGNGNPGGSGGSGGRGSSSSVGAGTPGQGNPSGTPVPGGAGGGGGKGGAGGATFSAGAGLDSSITGSPVTYAQGGPSPSSISGGGGIGNQGSQQPERNGNDGIGIVKPFATAYAASGVWGLDEVYDLVKEGTWGEEF